MSTLQIDTPRVFLPFLEPTRYKGAYGGRGSGKSHFFAEMAVERCLMQPGSRIVGVREVQKSLKESVKRLIEDKIQKLGVGGRFDVLTDQIKTPGGGIILFQGMQDHTAESIKSLEGFDVAWVEEAQTMSARSLEMLRPTIRKPGSELWFSWNPRNASDPVDALLRGPELPKGAVVRKVNHSDNAGPKAVKALDLHDRYIRMQQNTNMPVLNALKRTAGPEAAFNWAMAGAKDGGSRLLSLRMNMRPEEWDEVAASVFDQMGRARPGAAGASSLGEQAEDFSINTFLTNWSRMAPSARRALFGGRRYSEMVPELENLARVTARMKDAEKMANPSGTARNLLAAAALSAAATDAINGNPERAALGLAAGVIAPRVAAKLLTNPKTIRWLAQGAMVPLSNRNALSAHLGRLVAIGKAEPELREAVDQFVQSFRPATPPSDEESSATGRGR